MNSEANFYPSVSAAAIPVVLALALSALAACDPNPNAIPALEEDGQAGRGPLGKADWVGSCDRNEGVYCGGKSPDHCWCDELCTDFGDCCADYEPVCACEPATCEVGDCGAIDDGCDGTVDCGPCCEPVECSPDDCGTIEDGCGGTVDCGDCFDPLDASSCAGNTMTASRALDYFAGPEPSVNVLRNSGYYLYSRHCPASGCSEWRRRLDMEATTRIDEGNPALLFFRSSPDGSIRYRWQGYVEGSWARSSPYRPLPVPSDVHADRYRRYGSGHTDSLSDASFNMASAKFTEECYRAESEIVHTAGSGQWRLVIYGDVRTPNL